MNVRADNTFRTRMVAMSTPVTSTNHWRTEQVRTFDILSQAWTGSGGTPLGGVGVFGLRGDQELLVFFDRAGGQPPIYALWVLVKMRRSVAPGLR